MRLNKYIAEHGITSRRKADLLVEEGKVKINGEVMKTLGYEVKEGDKVEVSGVLLETNVKRTYYMVNKPLGYITSLSDPQGRPVVTELLSDVTERVFPVGRLDEQTTGLLIMTNDGETSYKMAHPKHEVGKTYEVLVKGFLSRERIRKLEKGVDIGGYITKPAKVMVVNDKGKDTLINITITEGKNRQVRKMMKAVGNPVIALKRISVGELKLGRLKEGHYRKLTKEEVDYIKGL